jgi:hypothetical protein
MARQQRNATSSPNTTIDPVVSFDDTMKALGTPPEVFQALLVSGLLGPVTSEGVSTLGLKNFQRYGTQWRTDIGERHVPYHDLPLVPDPSGSEQPISTYTQAQISPYPDPSIADNDTGWIAQFYIVPNRYFYPNPLSLALIGSPHLKLTNIIEVRGTAFPTYLCPDPTKSLAMVMVCGNPKPEGEPFETAYSIISPILDELSLTYDQPLPIAHNIVVGIPSGIVTFDFMKGSKIVTINEKDTILPHCPFEELKEAVALYREGISSNNPFHQFLTLWKVYENVARVRSEWRKKYKQKVIEIHQEIIPNIFAFASYEGQSFEQVKESLRKTHRHAIAHSDYKENIPKTAAKVSDFIDVSTMVPIMRYMARIILDNVRATLESTSGKNSSN